MFQAKCDGWRQLVLRFCIRPVNGAFMLLAIMDIRAHPISFSEGPERPVGSPDHGCDGETVSPSPQSDSQTSVVRLSIEVAQNSRSHAASAMTRVS